MEWTTWAEWAASKKSQQSAVCSQQKKPWKKFRGFFCQLPIKHPIAFVRANVFSIANASGVRIATAKVLSTYKGQAITTVSFVAQRTWTCDSSNAKTGEDVLLYLIPAMVELTQTDMLDANDAITRFNQQGKPLFYICGSGRGRMPLTKGKSDFTLPVEFVPSNLGDDKWEVNFGVRLPNGKLCRHVKKDNYTISLKNILTYR